MSVERKAARESAAAIDEAAARWASRVDREALSVDEEAALEAWLSGDARRAGAFARARAISAHFDRAKALGADFDAARFESGMDYDVVSVARGSRLRWLAAAASIALIAVAAISWIQLSADAFATKRGEMRLVPLSDGSAVTLNTASRIKIRYTPERRSVELVEGEALFNVAKMPGRPFVVVSGDTEVHVLGTSFTVSRMPGHPVRVVVREGAVAVKRRADVSSVRMSANTRLEIEKDAHVPLVPAPITAREVSRELAWREGMISLDGISLRAAAEEFARYSDTKIVIEDPEVAERTVTGLFAASNAAGFARAVAYSMGLQAEATGDSIHLRR